jgi:hypothetical protein
MMVRCWVDDLSWGLGMILLGSAFLGGDRNQQSILKVNVYPTNVKLTTISNIQQRKCIKIAYESHTFQIFSHMNPI